jgi:hypothetical protein
LCGRRTFSIRALRWALSRPTNLAYQLLGVLKPRFGRIFRPSTLYRATGVILLKLEAERARQLDLFGETLRVERVRQLYHAVNAINRKYGKHMVFLGSSFPAVRQSSHAGERGDVPERQKILFKGETATPTADAPLPCGYQLGYPLPPWSQWYYRAIR